MAGGAGRVISGGGRRGGVASVVNNRLLVDAIVSGGGGGGGNVTIVAPLPLPVDIQASISLPINDDGGSITVDGTVAVSAIATPVTLVEPVSVDDNGGSLTVDGTVAVSSIASPVQLVEPVSVDDNGGSLTVDGTVTVSSITNPVTIVEPVSVDDNGGSLTVDGTVAVSSITTSVVPGTGNTNLGKAEDAVHASGSTGIMPLAVRQDTLAALAGNGDYIPFTTDSLGRLNVLAFPVDTIFPLSLSTNGRPIAIDVVDFTNIHTVPANSRDVITLFASNVGTTDRTMIIGWGGVATAQQMFVFLPAGETVVVADEFVLNAGETIAAALNVAGTARIVGKVSRRSA